MKNKNTEYFQPVYKRTTLLPDLKKFGFYAFYVPPYTQKKHTIKYIFSCIFFLKGIVKQPRLLYNSGRDFSPCNTNRKSGRKGVKNNEKKQNRKHHP